MHFEYETLGHFVDDFVRDLEYEDGRFADVVVTIGDYHVSFSADLIQDLKDIDDINAYDRLLRSALDVFLDKRKHK